MNIDQIDMGTAQQIQNVPSLPTTGIHNYQQGTLFKTSTGAIYRLIKPIINATPLSSDFEFVVAPAAPTVVASTVILTATTTNPTIGSGVQKNNITLIDDNSGYCDVIMNLSYHGGSGTNGNGDYIVQLPSGYSFDTAAQPISTETQSPANNNYADMGKLIPAFGTLVVFSSTTYTGPVIAIVPASSTGFKVVGTPSFDAHVPRYWRHDWYQCGFSRCSYQLSFKFKKS